MALAFNRNVLHNGKYFHKGAPVPAEASGEMLKKGWAEEHASPGVAKEHQAMAAKIASELEKPHPSQAQPAPAKKA